MLRRRENPIGPGQVLPVALPVRLESEVVDPRREALLELGH
jgi:hypothetical protein